MVESALNFIPVYVLVLFRIGGMMIFAPLLGSDRIPRRVRTLIAAVMAATVAAQVHLTVPIPETSWGLTVAIGGELVYGLAMGMILSLIFIAAQWAGGMIGTQMGLNLGQTLDPQFGGQGSFLGDLYFFLTLMIFIAMRGESALITGIGASFQALPLMSVGMNRDLMMMLVGLFQSATLLAVQLSAPVLVTMLIVDLILGFIGKTVPQMNIMTTGISVRMIVGMAVVIVSLSLTSAVLRDAMLVAMKQFYEGYTVH